MAYSKNASACEADTTVLAQRLPLSPEPSSLLLPSRPLSQSVTTTSALGARRVAVERRLPGMLYAAVAEFGHTERARLELAMADVRQAPGVVNVISFPCAAEGRIGVATVARGFWLARQSLARLIHQAGVDSGPAGALNRAALALEPTVSRAIAQCFHGPLRLWLGTSDAARVVEAAARASGLPADRIDLHTAGFGEGDLPPGLLEAAIALALALQPAPVQVILPLYAELVQQAPGVQVELEPQVVAEAAVPVADALAA